MIPLDNDVLARLESWARGTDFGHHHLTGGLTMAHYVCHGGEAYGHHVDGLGGSPNHLFALAADLTFLVWVNDHIEACGPTNAAAGSSAVTRTGLTFADHVARLSTALGGTRFPECERAWWDSTLHDACVADHAALVYGRTWSYSEYLDNGIDSINIPHVMATISSLWGFGIARRRADPLVAGVIRHLGIQQRLSNDLASITKERRSEDPGNAALLMERYMSPVQAAQFIAEEQQGHHRMLTRLLNGLSSSDPLARAAMAIAGGLEGAQRDLQRYKSDCSP
ncbi:terpene synthase family protein [Nocardia sp. NPDC052316]|uniref:terpene synthase family protein n=1 Tax=Nocardia sp. NPDC052316 TaxID=3364329 RepID=UPI0037CC1DBF